MLGIRAVARVGMLALGLGIAATPGAAWADSSSDPFGWLAGLDPFSAAAAPTLDFQISIDGYDLVPAADTSATATSGTGDIAIAFGSGSTADATGGVGNVAFADGSDALAKAGGSSTSVFDTAVDIGDNTEPTTGDPDGAFAGDSSLIGATDGGTGSYDTAIDVGNNGPDSSATIPNGEDGALAGAGGLLGLTGNGNHDTAIDFGNNNGFQDGAQAADGTGDGAGYYGNSVDDQVASFAGVGNDNLAESVGNNSDTFAGGIFVQGGTPYNDDIAYVLDPFGTEGSNAFAGSPGSSDLAAVLFLDGVTADITDANNMVEILPPLSSLF